MDPIGSSRIYTWVELDLSVSQVLFGSNDPFLVLFGSNDLFLGCFQVSVVVVFLRVYFLMKVPRLSCESRVTVMPVQ